MIWQLLESTGRHAAALSRSSLMTSGLAEVSGEASCAPAPEAALLKGSFIGGQLSKLMRDLASRHMAVGEVASTLR
jgi:hypothetical protein